MGRRANNIKDKRKFEKLGEPQILGPFWWSGKVGCKKELKKWQPYVFPSTPIDTGYSRVNDVTHQDSEEFEAEVIKGDQVNNEYTQKGDQNVKENQMTASYNDKYCIK